jgi:bidirectional [NiFe] hydrogenase diaphorase subunit
MSVRTLRIDDREVGASAGETVLRVARENGIAIPTLCNLEGLHPVGACRLCLTEVEGAPKLMPACTTQVWEGMVVRTRSERLDRYRRGIVELLFAERNHVCAVCVASGHCELQSMAERQGMDHVRYPYLHPHLEVDASHALFAIDHNRCVLCTRCVRVCDEIEGAHTWDVAGRGVRSWLVTDLATPWGDSTTCTSCGKCVQVCPTGALFAKGKAVGEMERRLAFLPYLRKMRGDGP